MASQIPNHLVLFDCDGMLVDSQHNIVAAMTAAFRAHGLADPDAGAVRRVVGLHLQDAIARLVPDSPMDAVAAIDEAYVTAANGLRQRGDHEEPLFPGVREALDALEESNVILGIATGRSRRGLDRTLQLHGLSERFFVTKTADDGPGKPDPRIMLNAIAEAGAAPETTVMIGDTVFDISMARQAKAFAVGVDWGYQEVSELDAAGAHRILSHFDALPATVDSLWSAD